MGTKFEIFKYEVKVVRVTYQSHGITKEIDAETGSVIYALPNNAEIEFTDTRFNKDHTIKDTTKGSGKGHNATLFSGVSGDRRFIFNVTKSSRDVIDGQPGKLVLDVYKNPLGRITYLGNTRRK